MRAHPFFPLALGVVAATLGTHDVVACGDKFLVPSRGARFELSMAVRQKAAILLYTNPQSALAGTVARLSIDPALQKAGYRPTFVVAAAALEQALSRGGWDVVLADVADGPAVRRAVAAPDAPAVLAVVHETKGVDVGQAKKLYTAVLKTPKHSQTFVDAIDDALVHRRTAQAKAARK